MEQKANSRTFFIGGVLRASFRQLLALRLEKEPNQVPVLVVTSCKNYFAPFRVAHCFVSQCNRVGSGVAPPSIPPPHSAAPLFALICLSRSISFRFLSAVATHFTPPTLEHLPSKHLPNKFKLTPRAANGFEKKPSSSLRVGSVAA